MGTTQETTNNFEGLESLESSESVSSISDFLSFEQLGINTEESKTDIPLEEGDNNGNFSTSVEDTKEEKNVVDLGLPIIDDTTEDTVDLDEDGGNNVSSGASNYKDILKDLIESGVIDDIGAFETEDGEVSFDDMDIDKDLFLSLLKHSKEDLKTQLTDNTVSTEGISEFTQKLISIEKHGGSVQQALQAYKTIKQPLEGIDINDVRGQKAVCYLRLQQQGIAGEEARDLIETYERKGVLEDKAYAYKEQLDTAFNDWMLKQEEKAIEEDRLYKESLKAYKSGLNEAFKNAKEFNLSDTHRKKLVDFATKEDQEGNFEVDKLIDNFRSNPIKAAELILFLTDQDAYIKTKAEGLLKEERKKTLRTINVIPKSTTSVNLAKKSKDKDELIISLDKL